MNTELFIARRLFGTEKGEERFSRPAVTIAQWGVAIGIMVMIVSMSIVVGFKHEIRDKIIGFGGHIQVRNYETSMYGESPVTTSDADINKIASTSGIRHVQRFIQKPGLLSANDEFEGVLIKGIGEEYDTKFLADHIIAGEFPKFSENEASNKIVLSSTLADKLQTTVGEKINIYFLQDAVKARRMQVAGIYATNMSEMDNLMAFTDIYTTRRLNNWASDKATGIEITVEDYEQTNSLRDNLLNTIAPIADKNREQLYVQTVEELNPALFSWLSLLDQTVWIILILVLGIAGFTMVSGLLILILEKTNLIGVLKALGAKDLSIRKIFLYYGMFIIGRGMLWGNIIGLGLCIIQQQTGIIALDPQMYYMNRVPIEFTWWLLPLNISMFALSVAMLVIPSMLISRIEPTKAIKFE